MFHSQRLRGRRRAVGPRAAARPPSRASSSAIRWAQVSELPEPGAAPTVRGYPTEDPCPATPIRATQARSPPSPSSRSRPSRHRGADGAAGPDYGEESYKGLGRLTDRVALVTGGDSGIGRAVALAFAREGADVAIAYLNEHEDADGDAARGRGRGAQGAARCAGDLARRGALPRASSSDTVKRFGRIDVLVNNAAFQGKAVETLRGPRRRARRAHLPHQHPRHVPPRARRAAAHEAGRRHHQHRLHPGLPAHRRASSTTPPPRAPSSPSPRGSRRTLIERGIRVNSVAPGPGVDAAHRPVVRRGEGRAVRRETSPMGRPAQPAELAPAFVFLACDESRYVNGEVLGVTGGKVLA